MGAAALEMLQYVNGFVVTTWFLFHLNFDI